nr:(deoxy)nucleoside triphosphate pyrophosphohydrolase [Sphingobium jiangsuense]
MDALSVSQSASNRPDSAPTAERARLLVTAAALVDADGRILVQQRPEGKPMAGLWEFPGGKVEPGETPEEALIRELKEELGISTHKSCLAPVTFASEPLGDRDLLLLLYICRKWTGVPRLHHASPMQWVRPAEMFSLPMPPADLPMIGILDALV